MRCVLAMKTGSRCRTRKKGNVSIYVFPLSLRSLPNLSKGIIMRSINMHVVLIALVAAASVAASFIAAGGPGTTIVTGCVGKDESVTWLL